MCMGDTASGVREPTWAEAMNTMMAMERHNYAKENLQPAILEGLASAAGSTAPAVERGMGMTNADVNQRLRDTPLVNPVQGLSAEPYIGTAGGLSKAGLDVNAKATTDQAGTFQGIQNRGRGMATTAQSSMGIIAARAAEEAIRKATEKTAKKGKYLDMGSKILGNIDFNGGSVMTTDVADGTDAERGWMP